MAPERYLFRADSEGYAYRRILEVRPGSVRLLQPSENARRFTRWISTLFALGFVFVFGAFVSQTAIVLTLSGLSGLVIEAALIAFYFAGSSCYFCGGTTGACPCWPRTQELPWDSTSAA